MAKRQTVRTQLEALDESVTALAAGVEHAAIVELCRGLASVVDGFVAEGAWDEGAWREYRQALKTLWGVTGGSHEDAFAELTAELERRAGEVRNDPD